MKRNLTEGQKLADCFSVYTVGAVIQFIVLRLITFTVTALLWILYPPVTHIVIYQMVLFICSTLSAVYLLGIYHGLKRYVILYHGEDTPHYLKNESPSKAVRLIKWLNSPIIPREKKDAPNDMD